jgi:hypothetical protein
MTKPFGGERRVRRDARLASLHRFFCDAERDIGWICAVRLSLGGSAAACIARTGIPVLDSPLLNLISGWYGWFVTNQASRDQSSFFFNLFPPPSSDAMVDDLTGGGDAATGRGVIGGDEERTSPKPRTAWLAAASPMEARKELRVSGAWVLEFRVWGLARVCSSELGEV